MAFDPHEGSVGGEIACAVPKEWVARISGVSSEDVALGDFADQPLTVGENGALEVEMGEDLQATGDGEKFHEGGGAALVGAETFRSEGDDDDGATRPVPIGCHEDEAAPPPMTVPREEVVVHLWG